MRLVFNGDYRADLAVNAIFSDGISLKDTTEF